MMFTARCSVVWLAGASIENDLQCVWRQSLGEVGLERVNLNRKREGSRESKGLERKRK